MNEKIIDIYNFKCPRWDELPNKAMFSSEVIDYVSKALKPIIIDEEDILTSTMIQNYVKWGILPRPHGKKYGKEHIARLIVILIYKKVLNIKNIEKGINLQLNLMEIKEGYNKFCESLEDSLKNTFLTIKDGKPFKLDEIKAENHEVGIKVITYSFTLNLLGNLIIDNDGFKNIGGNYE